MVKLIRRQNDSIRNPGRSSAAHVGQFQPALGVNRAHNWVPFSACSRKRLKFRNCTKCDSIVPRSPRPPRLSFKGALDRGWRLCVFLAQSAIHDVCLFDLVQAVASPLGNTGGCQLDRSRFSVLRETVEFLGNDVRLLISRRPRLRSGKQGGGRRRVDEVAH
jgi:hypothetical protein